MIYFLIFGCAMFVAIIIGVALLHSSPRDEYPHSDYKGEP